MPINANGHSLGAGAAVAALAITGWFAPAWGKVAPPARQSRMSMTRPAGDAALATDLAAARV